MISLNLSKCKGFAAHRSGWSFCMHALKPFHSLSGIFVDDFVERSFSWQVDNLFYGPNVHNLPYRREWVGFMHNPPDVPNWFDTYNSPQAIIDRDAFKESLKYCKCLITLSDYLKNWLSDRLDVPVISIRHPTEIPQSKWCPIKFRDNPHPPVMQIGYWLRNMKSILALKTSYPYRKVWLPSSPEYAIQMLHVQEKTQCEKDGDRYMWASVEYMKWVSNYEYDELLTSGVVFLDLYDSSANNAVIEAIARTTPILVNRLPAVVEYCGEDYPLYYDNLDEAAALLCDKQKIFDAHEHLKALDTRWLSGNYFAADLSNKLARVLVDS